MSSLEVLAAFRSDFFSFVRKAFRASHGGKKLKDAYVHYLCYRLAEIASGESRRMVVNLPPRHLKTYITCWLVAWILGRDPSATIMVLSYSEDLAELITRQIRDVMKMDWYKEVFPGTRLASDHTSVSDFGTTKHGTVRAFSIEGGITGFGADYIIVDDPLQIQDADNYQQIDHVNSLFDEVVRTRLNDPEVARILIVAHRLNEEDLCGHVIKEGEWDLVVMPFMAERAQTLNFGDESWSRNKGDLLRESYGKEVKRISAQANYQALYQQNPRAVSLPRIIPEHFPLYDPSNIRPSLRVLSIDPGEQQGERNSYSVAQIWGFAGTGYFLEDLRRVRLRYDALRSLCKDLIRNFRPSAILIEEAGLGMALLGDLKRKDWQNLVPMRPRQSKIERLRKHTTVIRSRKIMVPSNALWRDYYIQEFTSFPNCKYTDQVDATTQFLEYMATNPILREPPARALFGIAFGSNPQSRAAPALNQGPTDPAAPGIIQVAPPSYRKRYRW